jgi:general secretion pathway protein L
VVSRSLLQGWLAALDAAGIEPAAIYPDMSLLPSNPGQTVLWLEKSRLSVRHPGKLPFAVEVTPLTEALIVAGIIPDPLAEGGSAEPQSAILYATHEDWAGVADEVEKLTDQFASIKVQLLPDGPLPWLARSLPQTDAVNLLQGEFARTADYGATWRQWRTAAALAVGLLVVHMAAQAVQIRQARHETAQLDGQIARLFSQAMPSEKLHDARKQMQARLERIRHSGPGAEYFLRTLQALSGAMPATGKTSIDSLSYRENSLELKVTAPSLSDLSQLSQQLARQGLTAEIQSSTPVGSTVEAHLQIRTAGSKARP